MFSQEQFLAGSFYGKFFARHLNLYLLQRKPEEWRNLQIQSKAAQALKSAPAPSTTTKPSMEPAPTSDENSKKKRKRGSAPGNEIDALFDTSLGKKLKRAALNPGDLSATNKTDEPLPTKDDKGLVDIISAIRAAPKGDSSSSRKKKSKHT